MFTIIFSMCCKQNGFHVRFLQCGPRQLQVYITATTYRYTYHLITLVDIYGLVLKWGYPNQ